MKALSVKRVKSSFLKKFLPDLLDELVWSCLTITIFFVTVCTLYMYRFACFHIMHYMMLSYIFSMCQPIVSSDGAGIL